MKLDDCCVVCWVLACLVGVLFFLMLVGSFLFVLMWRVGGGDDDER